MVTQDHRPKEGIDQDIRVNMFPSAVEGDSKPFVQSSARWSMETVATTAPLSSRWMQRASLLGPKITGVAAPMLNLPRTPR